MLATFGLSSWVCGALLLPLWLKSRADRWVVAAGLGVAVAALAALGCASWAGQAEDSSPDPGERSISAGGDITGIASTGSTHGCRLTTRFGDQDHQVEAEVAGERERMRGVVKRQAG